LLSAPRTFTANTLSVPYGVRRLDGALSLPSGCPILSEVCEGWGLLLSAPRTFTANTLSVPYGVRRLDGALSLPSGCPILSEVCEGWGLCVLVYLTSTSASVLFLLFAFRPSCLSPSLSTVNYQLSTRLLTHTSAPPSDPPSSPAVPANSTPLRPHPAARRRLPQASMGP